MDMEREGRTDWEGHTHHISARHRRGMFPRGFYTTVRDKDEDAAGQSTWVKPAKNTAE